MIFEVIMDRLDQIGDAFENTATDPFVSNLPEPALDQIQPGTGCGNKMQIEPWMPFEPGFDSRMLVGAVIVDDEMEIITGGSVGIDFTQESDKLLMPVAWHTIADYLSVEHTQGSEQGGGAVALVIVSHRPAASLLHRQPGLCAVQSLDLAFLIDAKNQGFIGRIQIKADDIREFLHEILVSAELEGFDQVGFEIMSFPYSANRRFAQPLSFGHGTSAPMGRIGRGRMKRGLDDRADFFLGNPRNASGARGIFLQTWQAKGKKALSPQLDCGTGDAKLRGNLLTQDAIACHTNDLGPLNKPERQTSTGGPSIQSRTFFGRQCDGFRHSHGQDHKQRRVISKDINDALH